MKKPLVISALAMFALAPIQSVVVQQSGAPGAKKGLAGLFSITSEDELIEPDAAFRYMVKTKGHAMRPFSVFAAADSPR